MENDFILASVICQVLTNVPVWACTGLVVNDGERVLVGNNEDWFNPRTKIWFTQPGNGRYGSVYFGFNDFGPQGGMNRFQVLLADATGDAAIIEGNAVIPKVGLPCQLMVQQILNFPMVI